MVSLEIVFGRRGFLLLKLLDFFSQLIFLLHLFSLRDQNINLLLIITLPILLSHLRWTLILLLRQVNFHSYRCIFVSQLIHLLLVPVICVTGCGCAVVVAKICWALGYWLLFGFLLFTSGVVDRVGGRSFLCWT